MDEYNTNQQQDTEVVEAEVTENNDVTEETKKDNGIVKKFAAIGGGILMMIAGIVLYKKKVSPALKKLKAEKAKRKAAIEAEYEDHNSEEESEG